MPRTLFGVTSKKQKRITYIVLSHDWWSVIPWTHHGESTRYFDKRVELNSHEDIIFTHWYIGPIAVVSGKYIK